MVNISSLPNELLLIILAHSPDARTAARLSQVNRSFYENWNAHSNQILTSVFQRDILAFDQALILAKAELLFEAENLDTTEIDIRQLACRLVASQGMLARLLPLYEHYFDDQPHHDHVYNAMATARAYFYSRFVMLAHDNVHMRRGVRRALKRLPEEELSYHICFLEWFVDELADYDIRNWHDLGLREDEKTDRYANYGIDIPMKWHFTVETYNVQVARLEEPDMPIGKDGLWSNRTGQGFQDSWW